MGYTIPRIYYYKGQIYELATLKGVSLEYNAGTPIMEAKGLGFFQEREPDHCRSNGCG